MVNLTCFIGVVLLGLISSALAEKSSANYTHYRLPQNVRPINYNLTLMIDVEQDTFQGSVEVQILVTAPTSMIVIHAYRLTFVKAFLRYFETNEETEVILDHSNYMYDYWILKLQKNIEPGQYFLGIEYMTEYFYDYELFKVERIVNNNQLLVATTQGAKGRSILPCFDEPALKATFDVTVIQPLMDGYYALSNMDVKDVIEDGNSRTTIFKRTPSMSASYLGLIITAMAYKSVKVYQEGVGEPYELRIYAKDNVEYVDPLLNLVKETMEFFAQYTNIPYPLPKLDLVVLDSYYQEPIVESLGLVIMRFRSLSEKPYDIYYTSEYQAYSFIQSAVLSDTSPNEEPLERTLKNVRSIYDFAGRGKGFSLLMMAESVVGQDNFKKAVSNYLKKHMYGTVTTSDLIEELQDVYSDIHLTNMMKSFSTYPNFPIVTLQKLADGSYILKQKIYDEESAMLYDEQVQRYSVIPVTIKTAEKSELIWMKSSEYVIPDLEADWAVISARGFGYYQTNYSENLWLALANVLQEDVEVFDSLGRINLLRSVWPDISKLSYDIAFEMFRFLEKETNMLVWIEALVILEDVRSSLKGDALYGFMKYGQKLIGNYYRTISWTKDTLDTVHYEEVFKFACRCELEGCLVFAETLFKDIDVDSYMWNTDQVIAVAAMKKTTDADVWQEHWEAFDANPRFDRYSMLMTSKDPEFLKKVLQRTASEIRGWSLYEIFPEVEIPVDAELVWSLLRKELGKNEKTPEYEVYVDILEFGADPEIFAAIYGSSEMKAFAKRTGSYINSYELSKAIERAEKVKPAKKWLKENGFLKSNWKLITF